MNYTKDDNMKEIDILFHHALYPCLRTGFIFLRKHKFIYQNPKPHITGNVIYAVNHSCKYDTQYVCEVIGKQAYVLAGVQQLDPIDRIAFHLIGTVWVDRKSRDDREDDERR